MINKIVLFNLTDRCNTLKRDGISNAEIARTLSNKSGRTITPVNVGRYFKAEKYVLSEAISANTKLQIKKAHLHLDAISQLSYINEETHHILDSAKQSGDLKIALQAIARVEGQLELQARLLGDISDAPKILAIKEIVINEQNRAD